MTKPDDAGRAPVDAVVIRPGRGWSHVAGSVWEHTDSALRLHVGGVIRLPDGQCVSANEWPESLTVRWYVRANGGNRKRGLMAWARSKVCG